MKISYFHLENLLKDSPSANEISNKLIQLGHENTLRNNIFDIEFTPNRGDALSVNGILRDLNIFFETDNDVEIYSDFIESLEINFINNDWEACPNISFLEIEIERPNNIQYSDYLERFFVDLDQKKNNFFTDISNFLLYELGQPTHCYDLDKISKDITFEKLDKSSTFEAIGNKKFNIDEGDYVFKNDESIINLAGIMGGECSSCSRKTSRVLVECAYFKPDSIIGRATKYNLSSEASYRFERGCDIDVHDKTLRRFIKIVSDHSKICGLRMKTFDRNIRETKSIPFDLDKISKILGTDISEKESKRILEKFGFIVSNEIKIPSYRSDIYSINDIAEEIARAIGYDNIIRKEFIPKDLNKIQRDFKIEKIREYFSKNCFNEVINYPFADKQCKNAIIIDNPLDSSKSFLRTRLKESLLENLLFNERRQKESIKMFELSNIYERASSSFKKSVVLGVIATGRLGKNYKEFSKKIDQEDLDKVLSGLFNSSDYSIEQIDRSVLDTKKKDKIFYSEIKLDSIVTSETFAFENKESLDMHFHKFIPFSEYPSVSRDLSFLVRNQSNINFLENLICSIDSLILKESFIFDFYVNNEKGFIKIGYRFVFQSIEKTLEDKEVDLIMSDIVRSVFKNGDIEIPGYEN